MVTMGRKAYEKMIFKDNTIVLQSLNSKYSLWQPLVERGYVLVCRENMVMVLTKDKPSRALLYGESKALIL